MKQMYSLEIPVCSFLAKCPSTQVFSDAFIFLSLSILNLFTQLLFTSVYFSNSLQRAKKVLSDSPGLVDFAIGLVNSVFNLPDGQVMFYEEFE